MIELTGKIRPLKCQMAYLEKADGSCSYSQGHTTVWASCSGPGDVHASRRENHKMHLDVSFRSTSGDLSHSKFNSLLRSSLNTIVNTSLFPRTCLIVTVNVLEDFGSVSAAGITATSLALLDNGVPINALFCAVNVVRVNGKLILDPEKRDEQKSDAEFTFVFQLTDHNGIEVIGSDCTGVFKPIEFSSALSLAKEGSKDIFAFLKETLLRKMSVETI